MQNWAMLRPHVSTSLVQYCQLPRTCLLIQVNDVVQEPDDENRQGVDEGDRDGDPCPESPGFEANQGHDESGTCTPDNSGAGRNHRILVGITGNMLTLSQA